MLHITTAWSPEYEPLARITYPGKVNYANKWGHTCGYKIHLLEKTQGATYKDVIKHRAKYWWETLDTMPEGDWMWFTGCDTLITNPSIDIKRYIDEDYDLIAANDCNCINTDSMLVKSNVRTKLLFYRIVLEVDRFGDEQEALNTFLSSFSEYPQFIEAVGFNYKSKELRENMIKYLNGSPVKFKLVSQKCFNTYSQKYIPAGLIHYLPTDGSEWTSTDLMLHMPRQSLEYRLKEFPFLIPEEHRGLLFQP